MRITPINSINEITIENILSSDTIPSDVVFTESSPSKNVGVVSLDNKMSLSGNELDAMHDFASITGPQCKKGVLLTANHPKGLALNNRLFSLATYENNPLFS